MVKLAASGKHLSEVQQTGFRKKTWVVAYIGIIVFEGEVLEMLSARGCPRSDCVLRSKYWTKWCLDEWGSGWGFIFKALSNLPNFWSLINTFWTLTETFSESEYESLTGHFQVVTSADHPVQWELTGRPGNRFHTGLRMLCWVLVRACWADRKEGSVARLARVG